MAGERQRMNELIDAGIANYEELRTEVNNAFPPEPSVITIKVKVGESVQSAYDTLLPTGGIIKLAPGNHKSDLAFPERPPDSKLIVFTSDSENLPGPDKMINPSYLPAMAVLQSGAATTNLVRMKNKNRNTSFVNVAVGPPMTKSYTTVEIGGDKRSMPTPADRPSGYVFDRVYIYGDPTLGAHRGISLNGKDIRVVNSYVKDLFEFGRDSQALGAWNGAENIQIENCYLEGGAENVMFGGSDSASPEMTCCDITMRKVHLSKNFAWMSLGSGPSIKCLFEIKNVKRMLIEDCLWENCWARDWATGVGFMLKACNGENIETWATCEDVTIRNLVLRNVGSVIGLIGKNDSGRISDWMRRIKLHNILAYNINVGQWTGTGRGISFANGCEDFFEVDHFTMHTNSHSWMTTWFDSGITKAPGKFIMRNSVAAESSYGYISTMNSIGFGAADKDWTGTEFSGNAFKQGVRPQGTVPPDNLRLPPTNWDASFGPDHEILQGSAIAQVKTTDGKLPGADALALKQMADALVAR